MTTIAVPLWWHILCVLIAAIGPAGTAAWLYRRELRRVRAQLPPVLREAGFARGRVRFAAGANQALATVAAAQPYRTAVLEAIDDAYDVHPADDDPPEQPQAVTEQQPRPRDDDDDDDDRPTGGGGVAEAPSAPQYRYRWPEEPAPRQPWRAPIAWMRTITTVAVRQTIGVWWPRTRLTRICDRVRLVILNRIGRYRVAGRHRADGRLCWSEIAEECVARWRAECGGAAADARRLMRSGQPSTRRRWALAPGWRQLVSAGSGAGWLDERTLGCRP